MNPKREPARRLVKFRFTPSILPPNKVSCLRKSQNNAETNPSLGQGGREYSDISVTGMCKGIFLGGFKYVIWAFYWLRNFLVDFGRKICTFFLDKQMCRPQGSQFYVNQLYQFHLQCKGRKMEVLPI